tara:strand:+ start:2618 stop:3061 length:444 start_codon:yes stop_codon:yes gene_type:complete
MIQLIRKTSLSVHLLYLNLYDKMTNADYRPLITVTSQLTGKSKTCIFASANYAYKDRYVQLLMYVAPILGAENLSAGSMYLGTTDYPLGFYDVTIYQNTDDTNIDPTGLTVIYQGLMNLTSDSNTNPVRYTEYNDNDSDTESVYITI